MNQLTEDEVRERAALHGQEYKGPEWLGMHVPVRWVCLSCGYDRMQAPRVILLQATGGNNGCKRCRTLAHHERARVKRQERVTRLLAERGGRCCLDGLPSSSRTTARWQCSQEGHPPFKASLDAIHRGRWCPRCTSRAGESYGEALCRIAFVDLLGADFPRRCLPGIGELDGYCETLRVAFEHQGAQHYGFVTRFHKTPEDFARQMERDRIKQAACLARGIFLVIIPAIPGRTRPEALRAFIIAELRRLGYPDLPEDIDSRPVNFSRVHRPDPHGRFGRLQQAASDVGLDLGEAGWMGASHAYHFRCRRCEKDLVRTATSFFHRARKGARGGCRACSLGLANAPQRKVFLKLVEAVGRRGLILLTSEEELYARADARATLACALCADAGRDTPPWTVGRRALLGGRYGCQRCAGRAKLSGEDVVERVRSCGWQLRGPYPSTITSNSLVDLVAPECGHDFTKRVSAIFPERPVCPGCQRAKRGGNSTRRLSQSQAQEAAHQAGWELLDPYRNNKVPSRYRCLACGETDVRTHNLLRTKPCPHCHPPGPKAGSSL